MFSLRRRSRSLLVALAGVALLSPLLASAPATAQTPPAPPSEQQRLTTSLRGSSDGDVTIDRDPVTGAVTFVGTEAGAPLTSPTEASGDPAAAAGRFVREYGTLFGAPRPSTLERESVTPRVDGGATVRFRQVVGDVPVLAGELAVQVDDHGDVLSALGELQPRVAVATEPTVSAGTAAAAAVEATAKAHGVAASTLDGSEPERWVYAPDLLGGPSDGRVRLTWRVEVTGPGTDEPIRELVLVDATSGGIALQFNQVASGLDRSVCDFAGIPSADETCVPPFVRTEGDPASGDADIDNAYDFSGDTYQFFFDRFGRDSVDDAGLPLISAVRYCPSADECPYDNAFWNGSQMTYGAGFASADDVVGHELTHGVTEHSSGLFYYFQSGAINESLSDVFGEFVDQDNGDADTRWLMGEDLPGIQAIRDMANPPAFGDPDKMTSPNYTLGLDDGGGVHTNSGVSNKAAFLLTDGGTFNGRTVPALGLTKTARIYYEAATTLLVSGSDYADLGRALVQACTNVVGTDAITTADCAGVQQAVDATEMATSPPNAPAPEAPGCAAGTTATTVFSDDLENTASGNWAVAGTPGRQWAYPQNPNYFSPFDATYATSGDTNFFGPDFNLSSDTTIARTASVVLPPASILVFNHAYELENTYDGGTVEYSTNGGSTWTDAGPLFTANGYNGTASGGTGSSVPSFTGLSNGYRSSQINLAGLAGQNLRFRFRLRTDNSVSWFGWFVDDVRILSCQTPTVRPDGHVRLGATGAFAGDDVYNTTGAGQTRSTTVGAGGTATFYVRIQNDGNVTEPMTVKGTAGTTRFKITYFAGTTDVTNQVTAGTYPTGPLPPGANVKLKVVIKAKAGTPVGASITASVKVTSTTDTTKKDVVKATVTRNR